jgi:MFS superfamily sulfate permease-like transporter
MNMVMTITAVTVTVTVTMSMAMTLAVAMAMATAMTVKSQNPPELEKTDLRGEKTKSVADVDKEVEERNSLRPQTKLL